ncbi:MAG: hypothetical protein OEN50_02185 [Deltaproteobacteria bacterium]|nr:hypothetical protein [Deltaproteobacteria bacterium]
MIDVAKAGCAILTIRLFRSIFPPMLRRVSSILLTVCLIALSGIDLLEDLRAPGYSGVFRSPAAQLPQFVQGQALANDIIESAGRPRPPVINLLKASPADADCDNALLSFKPRPLHKLNRVYLI